MIRLLEKEIEALVSAVEPFVCACTSAELYLHGSRTDILLKGGDIDLLLIVDVPSVTSLNRQKSAILTAIEKKLGERRVDLLIVGPAELNDPFLERAMKKAVLIRNFKLDSM